MVLDARPPRRAGRRPQRQPARARPRRRARCSSPPTSPRSSGTPSRSSTWTTARSPPSRADGYQTRTLDTGRQQAADDGRRRRRRLRARRVRRLHAQGDPRAAARRCAGCCAAGSTSGSPPRGSAASTSTPASCARSAGSSSSAAARPTTPARSGAALIEELARIPADAEPACGVPLPQPGRRPRHAVRRGQPVRRDHRHAHRGAGAAAQGRPGPRRASTWSARAIARECGGGHLPARRARRSRWPRPRRSPTWRRRFALLGLLLGRVRDLSAADGARLVDGLRRAAGPDRADPGRRRTRSRRWRSRYADAPTTCSSSAACAAGRSPARAPRSSRRSPTCTPRRTRPRELKHGPLALIDAAMPSVVIVPDDELVAKNISTIEQIKARGGPVIAVTSADLPDGLADAVHPGPAHRARARPDPAHDPAAAARLPRRRRARPRHRQAAEPGEAVTVE